MGTVGELGVLDFRVPTSSEEAVANNLSFDRSYTFWRFMIRVPLGPREMKVMHNVNDGLPTEFLVPTLKQNVRWEVYSVTTVNHIRETSQYLVSPFNHPRDTQCNAFSAGINPDDFHGPGFRTSYDPFWADLTEKHAEEPSHIPMGGGDQPYCVGVIREPESQDWYTWRRGKETISRRTRSCLQLTGYIQPLLPSVSERSVCESEL